MSPGYSEFSKMAEVGSRFQATSDEDFIGLESSFKVKIMVTNLPLYNV